MSTVVNKCTSNIIVMGECMVEFGRGVGCTGEDNLYKKSFAGDVFNTGIYIKRCVKEQANVKFLTAIGNDENSNEMLAMMEKESLDSSLVYKSTSAQMGLYLINVDSEGERSFSYWRETSAAKQVVRFLSDDLDNSALENVDSFFFSGISIAILSEGDRQKLWRFIFQLKASGTKIIFDPNYRPMLWSTLNETRAAYATAFELADIALPGVDDHMVLYNAKNAEDVAGFLEQFAISEIIIKNGSQGMLLSVDGIRSYIDVDPVKNVVDTTSAGDAFNGAYLSARLLGRSAEQSAKFAAKVSACIIQHKGAIVDEAVFSQQLLDYPM
ncbi:MAG: sugar kinase [Colwellia sp.]|uniref:sugar kinase n=1 Tax=Colwellia sp. TaxID=56799 RepID=UPI0025C41B72|nr:sugar kinase [Colwellia sp.]NQZ27953.1 sugar kinase [Colwellia sp.]